MPSYCYSTKDRKHRVELVRSIRLGPLPTVRRKIDGRMRTLYHDIAADHWSPATRPITEFKPFVCYAAGVAPNQVEKMRAKEERFGCPTQYTRDGDPIIRDWNHYKAYKKCHNMYDRNTYGGRGSVNKGDTLQYAEG